MTRIPSRTRRRSAKTEPSTVCSASCGRTCRGRRGTTHVRYNPQTSIRRCRRATSRPTATASPRRRLSQRRPTRSVGCPESKTDLARGDWHDPSLGAVVFDDVASQWLLVKGPKLRRRLRTRIATSCGSTSPQRSANARSARSHPRRSRPGSHICTANTRLGPNSVAKAYRVMKGSATSRSHRGSSPARRARSGRRRGTTCGDASCDTAAGACARRCRRRAMVDARPDRRLLRASLGRTVRASTGRSRPRGRDIDRSPSTRGGRRNVVVRTAKDRSGPTGRCTSRVRRPSARGTHDALQRAGGRWVDLPLRRGRRPSTQQLPPASLDPRNRCRRARRLALPRLAPHRRDARGRGWCAPTSV